MIAQRSMIDELEEAIASRRSAFGPIRYGHHLFSAVRRISDDQVELFDEVMGMLAREIESSARATFGQRLATLAKRRQRSSAPWRSTTRSR
jgi:hypothetical protein